MQNSRQFNGIQAHNVSRLLCLAFLLVSFAFMPQTALAVDGVTVHGIVTDADEEPLIGVSVLQEGTKNGVATNIDGEYSITVPVGSVLQFSYIGKKPHKVTVKDWGAAGYNVVLDNDNNMLDEVMVTGYATISKAQSTGAFQKISADALELRRMDNLESMLEGSIVGFVDGKIRGVTTMNAISNPLVVIDGFPVENTSIDRIGRTTEAMPDLNPEDIESVTVLKDAAAASIYGARAANGVIVITTKKAAEGKPEVSFSSTFTARKYSRYNDNLTNSADVIAIERAWAAQYPELLAGGESAAKVGDDLRLNSHPSLGVSTLIDMYSGAISMSEGNARLDALSALGYRYYDQAKEYGKRNPFHQQYNLRVAQ